MYTRARILHIVIQYYIASNSHTYVFRTRDRRNTIACSLRVVDTYTIGQGQTFLRKTQWFINGKTKLKNPVIEEALNYSEGPFCC